jgi:hypothetical protein
LIEHVRGKDAVDRVSAVAHARPPLWGMTRCRPRIFPTCGVRETNNNLSAGHQATPTSQRRGHVIGHHSREPPVRWVRTRHASETAATIGRI